MALSATRLVLATMLLGTSAISAHAGWFDFGSSQKAPVKDERSAVSAGSALPGTSLDDSVRQAQALRLAGSYPEAIKHLSQVMMIASDDPRVVSEYGKTLAAMGRAQDAVNFLTRAGQLQPTDWSVFSALGVAYDQLGNQKDAQIAYEHALILKPGEPSALSNYALSRMLANDPAMAKTLAGRAELANASAHDAKITANIALIRSMAPDAPVPSYAVSNPAPPPAAPRVPVATDPMPQAPTASNAPRPLTVPANATIKAPVTQAGGVSPKPAPSVFAPAPVKATAAPASAPAATKTAAASALKVQTPAKTAAAKPKDAVPELRVSASAY
ncbi:MAG: tetratricopeptide repeat protein [Alphaproteobacteria bacterium]|nr:tetratricopeptide repeat protein [Alphaproteobacteria bacterium]